MTDALPSPSKEIAGAFLKIGATAYGGPAIMGVMQAEIQERRQWTSKPRFLEGLGLVNVLPGATMVQLAMFLGYQRAGWWGGMLAGVCFTAPAFVVMLALAAAYAAFGVSPLLRGALYGLGPVVLAIFVSALFRLGKSAVRSWAHALIAATAAMVALLTPLGAAAILSVAGAAGVWLFHSKRAGIAALSGIVLAIALVRLIPWAGLAAPSIASGRPSLGGIAALFTVFGTFAFGGGLSMIALIQEHIVDRLHWLTPREFVDGLALGQLMPGPIMMMAAYVGYKMLGVAGAVVAAAASFVPSFVMMLALMPLFERARNLAWARAAIQAVVPAVIGVMAVALVRVAPYAAPDGPALVVFVVTAAGLVVWRLAPLKVMGGGTVFGILRAAVRA